MDETFELELKKLKKKKKNRKWLLLLLLLLLLLIMRSCVIWNASGPRSQYDIDRNALAGWLPGHTQEEIEAELNRIIDEGRFAVSINPMPVISGGSANFMLENVPANHYLMQVDIYVTLSDGSEKRLYRSGLIRQGYYIESADVEFLPEAGQYAGKAVFRALTADDKSEEIGQTEATLLIFVEE